VARYLLSSHDAFGLGHLRRNFVIARAVVDREPDAEVLLVNGVAVEPSWPMPDSVSLVALPPLLKMPDGGYCGVAMGYDETIRARRDQFLAAVEMFEPDAVLVDRHPFGVATELLEGLLRARHSGARLVLGLRDVLDDPVIIAEEMVSEGWGELDQMFDRILVYGSRDFCDHEAEYGLRVEPTYCGWVVEPSVPNQVDPKLLVVTAGGGGDGAGVFRLGIETLERRPDWRGVVTSGPCADLAKLRRQVRRSPANGRFAVSVSAPGCGPWFARAGAVLQMAGYNSTFEALAAGCKPILVPRRHPRREQLIRASRLAALGLADVIDESTPPAEVAWLLDQRRHLPPDALRAAGIGLDGAKRTAAILTGLAASRLPGPALHSQTTAVSTGRDD
jgi:predicted glycosyltransferase